MRTVSERCEGWKSAVLMTLPFLGAALALLYGRKSDYQWWPLFGLKYRL